MQLGGWGVKFAFQLIVLALVTGAVAYKAHRGFKQPDPALAGCAAWRTHMLTILLRTLGIQLGWSVKDVYDGVLAGVLADLPDHAPTVTHGAALGAVVLTLGALAAHSCFFGAWSKPPPAATTTELVQARA